METILNLIPDYPPGFWITAAFVVTFIGVSKAGFGGGAGAIATPLLAQVMPVADAAAVLLPLIIIADLLTARSYWASYSKRLLRLMLPGAMVGIVIGSLTFNLLRGQEWVLKTAIGVIALTFVIYKILLPRISTWMSGKKPPDKVGVGVSVFSGFVSTLAHVGGPPVAMFLMTQGLSRNVFVGTSVVLFMIVNLVKLIPYGILGLLRVGNIAAIFILAPMSLLGVWLGTRLNERFSDEWFNRILLMILFLVGIQLVVGESLVGLVIGLFSR